MAACSVWFAARASFSRPFSSSSWKTPHHSPLGTASFGSLCRQGSETSHFAVVGAVARSYFGPTVHPARNKTKPAAHKKGRKIFLWGITITASLRALRSRSELWTQAPAPVLQRHLLARLA